MTLGRVRVTGAGGLLGGYVVRELAGKAHVVGFDIVGPPDDAPIAEFHQGNIEDADAVQSAMAGCRAVVHFAARPNIWRGTGDEIIRINVTGTWNILQAAELAGAQRAVITSSDSVVGYTVLFGPAAADQLIALCDLPDGRRTIAYSRDAEWMARVQREELCGVSVRLAADETMHPL